MKMIVKMKKRKNIVMIAHDNRKKDLIEWVKFNKGSLSSHNLFATGTTGELVNSETGLEIHCLKSGPLGGDLQVGALITEQKIDVMFFFWDPLTAQPHDPDVKALMRVAVLWNIPIACNRTSADFIISSHLFKEEYDKRVIDYGARRKAYLESFKPTE